MVEEEAEEHKSDIDESPARNSLEHSFRVSNNEEMVL